MLDNPFHKGILPNIQSKPPLVQPETFSSHAKVAWTPEFAGFYNADTNVY